MPTTSGGVINYQGLGLSLCDLNFSHGSSYLKAAMELMQFFLFDNTNILSEATQSSMPDSRLGLHEQ